MLKAPQNLTPPTAGTKPYSATHHGITHTDPYHWLKDPLYPKVEDKEVLEYLGQENAYFEAVMDPVKEQTETLFSEIKGRIKEDETSVPWQKGVYDYRWAYAVGTQYKVWFYRKRSADAFAGDDWQVLFDENKEAEGLDFFKLGGLSVSPDGRYLAYSVDKNGSERFTVQVRDLEQGQTLDLHVEETSGEVVWAKDNSAFVAVKVSKEWRPYLVEAHRLVGESSVLYEEKDTSFFTHIGTTSSGEFLVIRSGDHVTAENHVVSLSDLKAAPLCLAPRSVKHDYYVDHGGQDFYIRSNCEQRNFNVYIVPVSAPHRDDWQCIIEGSDTRYIHGMQAFDGLLAVEERLGGLDQIYLWSPRGSTYIPFAEEVFEVGLGHNAEPGQSFIRLNYSSMTTPPTVYDYDLGSKELIIRKEQEIPSGYNKDDYRSERLMVTARDGTLVPVSLVYRAGWNKGVGAPVHLYGYGAYGLGMSPSFSAARLSLLDRGFAYAIAHIRGGDELGYGWYEAGKLEKRENTFNDFVDVAKGLVDQGYAAKGGISISGGSAGL